MTGETIAGTNLDGLELVQPPAPASAAAIPPKRGRGRPPGSSSKVAPVMPAAPVIPVDPEEQRRREKARQDAAKRRAQIPLTLAGYGYKLKSGGYDGKAFDMPAEKLETLTEHQRSAMRSVATMKDGFAKRLLTVAVGSDDVEDGPLMACAILVGAQADLIIDAIEQAEKDKSGAGKS